MKVRIRFGRGVVLRRERGKNRHIARAAAALLWPVAWMALILAAWRLAADMAIAQEFAIGQGPFAHWQVWAAVAAIVLYLALVLQRYGRTGRFT